MGRPPLPRGAHGAITSRKVGNMFEARCIYRGRNGAYSKPSAVGKSGPAAKQALLERLAELKDSAARKRINADARFSEVAERWVEDLEHQVAQGGKSPRTLNTYRSYLKIVNRHLGELRMWELEESVDVIDDMVKTVQTTMGFESAKKVRSVASLVCQLGIRRKAMGHNPVREIGELKQGRGPTGSEGTQAEKVPAMSLEQITEMLAGMDRFGRAKAGEADRFGRRLGKRGAVWTDLPDLAEAGLSTGCRHGELLALTGPDVIVEQGERGERIVKVNVDAHIVRPKGQGPRRVPGRKGNRPGIRVTVPPWSQEMWLRRAEAARTAGDGPLFPATGGGWLDQDNTNKRLRQALDGAGFEWVTVQVWRKTVGTLLRRAGLSVEDIAEQLGNTPAVVARHYVAPPEAAVKGAAVLEVIKLPTRTRVDHDGFRTEEDNDHEARTALPGKTVGAAGLEPATAREESSDRPGSTHTD